MQDEALTPLGSDAVFLLLVQLALILCIARLGAEAAKRVGLPAVVGELSAGIVLGPTVLGHFAPRVFATVFPSQWIQFNLLEVVGMLGMVLLLLLTGLETDLRLLRNLGRAALIASVLGMFVPFATGFALGLYMPDAYLAHPDQRTLFSLFLATAMSISAMPVIAKILMDLDLARRNIGLVILSAGVIDDTAGWLILSMISGVASHGTLRIDSLLSTLLLTACFLAAAVVLIYPAARFAMSAATRRFKTPDADLVVLLCFTFACAAVTEYIGVHAAFGAFIAGTLFRQVPHVRADAVRRLESFVFAVLAPVFFGIVGLHVDLWTIGGGTMLAIVLAVACLGKLLGCTVGSMWGGLRFWEGLSIAVAMNARGAMGLVVATIGLSLGILNQQMFSIIVMVAIVTSFMAPLGLRLTIKKVRMTDEEARRILAERTKGVIDPTRVRVLLPTAGGPNTRQAALLAAALAKRSADPVRMMFVRAPTRLLDRIAAVFRPPPPSLALDEQLDQLKAVLGEGAAPAVRRVEHRDVASAIRAEAEKGFDLIVMGASHAGNSLGGPVVVDVVDGAPCHVIVVKAGTHSGERQARHVLVPFDGGVFARVAVELAVRYAEATSAEVTIAVISEPRVQLVRPLDSVAVEPGSTADPQLVTDEDVTRISSIFHATEVRPNIVRLGYDPVSSAMLREAASGRYDMVMIGAENRAIQHRLFFGHDNERLIGQAQVTVAIVIPNVAFLGKEDPSAIASLQRPAATPPDGSAAPPSKVASSV